LPYIPNCHSHRFAIPFSLPFLTWTFVFSTGDIEKNPGVLWLDVQLSTKEYSILKTKAVVSVE
jgi:hypothetical protein